jgi:predicted DNA-binding transcriptional regulator AlpA
MPEPISLTATAVAQLLGITVETFYRRVTGLKRDHGFPPPLPGGRRYSAAAVRAWIDRGGAPPPAAAPALDDDVADCEQQLLARARRQMGEAA